MALFLITNIIICQSALMDTCHLITQCNKNLGTQILSPQNTYILFAVFFLHFKLYCPTILLLINFFIKFSFRFLHDINKKPNVYITTISRMLEYMKNPVLGKPFDKCSIKPNAECRKNTLQLTKLDKKKEQRYMTYCEDDNPPTVFPWLGNPYGEL